MVQRVRVAVEECADVAVEKPPLAVEPRVHHAMCEEEMKVAPVDDGNQVEKAERRPGSVTSRVVIHG